MGQEISGDVLGEIVEAARLSIAKKFERFSDLHGNAAKVSGELFSIVVLDTYRQTQNPVAVRAIAEALEAVAMLPNASEISFAMRAFVRRASRLEKIVSYGGLISRILKAAPEDLDLAIPSNQADVDKELLKLRRLLKRRISRFSI